MTEKAPKIGDQISCECGAEYEFGLDGRKLQEKDDARCECCRAILTSWPQRLSWRLIKRPSMRPQL
jgi:hypothetical protein